jgi:integrase
VLTRLLGQADERRNPRTKATVNQLLDRYLEVLDVDQSTRTAHEGYIERHIRPVVGDLQAGRVDVEALDSFYAQLRRCRRRCRRGGRRLIDHRTEKSTSATSAAAPTCAVRWRRPRSGRSTGSCRARSIVRCAGSFNRYADRTA